jgi:hypothetical protein
MTLETTVDGAGVKTGNHIPGNTRASVRGLWIFTGLWNLVSAPVLVYIPPELERQPLAGLGFLFPLVGAGLIVWASVTTARSRRFGTTWLEAGGEARPGGAWHAAVHVRLPAPEDGTRFTVTVKLTCLSRTISRSGDDTTVRENILWREEIDVDATAIEFGCDHSSIPVCFNLPADALETTAIGKGAGVLWVLTAEAVLPGVNLKEDFDVPVRRTPGTEDTGPRTRGASEDAQLRKGPAVSNDDLARTGITVEPSPDGMRFRFAPGRDVSFATGVTALTAVFVGALWMQWYLGFPWFFQILTGLVDLLLVYVVIDLWLGVTNVVAANGALHVRHSVLGAGRQRALPAADIAGIDLHINMQTQGRYGTPYYQVRARLKNGRTAGLADGIRNKRHAEWLAAQMRAAIGLRPV